jgi:hypothetical protein
MSRRIKVTFNASVDTATQEAFAAVIEMFGKIYRDHGQRSLVVLADASKAATLVQQLDAWVEDGALKWAEG